ncbi:transcription termination factor NusA [Eubacteriales bacterium OttesenSCG-928-A19]|nr:transcription termination factor NusA [Eubacteriales bacterium OttesenSCG-928-A19]
MNREVIEAATLLAKEKGIDKDVLFGAIEEALKSAYRKNFKKNAPNAQNVDVSIDRDTGAVQVFARKIVVEEVEDDSTEISLLEARLVQPSFEVGDIVRVEVTPGNFGRVAAQTAKQVIVQRIREAERGIIYDEYIEKENEILTAIVQRVEGKSVYVELGKTEGVIEGSGMMPGEEYSPGDRIKVYVLEVQRTSKGPQIVVSRTHPGLVKRLFELESTEIQNGIVQIKSIAREAGSRTKMAVHSIDPMVDPVGSCVGPRGTRVERVVEELGNEKIDIIKWSADPAEFIANALNPARVLSVFTAEDAKACRVIVPDNQLSLAIGKEGQNARLAAKLTGWKIDIKSQSQADELLTDAAEEAMDMVFPEEGEGYGDAGEYDLDAVDDLGDLGDLDIPMEDPEA